MTNSSPAQKRRRDKAERCYYCDCRLTHNIPILLPTDATIEHLNSRNQFPSGRPEDDNTVVIACAKCNEDRGDEETRGQGMYRLWELAGRWPSGWPHLSAQEADMTIETPDLPTSAEETM